MLTITVLGAELFDESTKTFSNEIVAVLKLEHSLVSLSKWESKFEVPFLGKNEKTAEQLLTYVRLMILTPDVSDEVLAQLSDKNYEEINDYINAKKTATWFNEDASKPKAEEVITSELIYYWMTVFSIPFTCENWHLNRLFTLIQICNMKQSKPKKMTRAQIAARNRELNEKRRKDLKTSG